MALPLTVFKTIPLDVPTVAADVYTAPTGYNAIILTAQAVNTDPAAQNFSMRLIRGSTTHPVVFDYRIPTQEVLIASGGTAGKLVLQSGDKLSIVGTTTNLKFTLSVLETLI
jgi:hypothetical protein